MFPVWTENTVCECGVCVCVVCVYVPARVGFGGDPGRRGEKIGWESSLGLLSVSQPTTGLDGCWNCQGSALLLTQGSKAVI